MNKRLKNVLTQVRKKDERPAYPLRSWRI